MQLEVRAQAWQICRIWATAELSGGGSRLGFGKEEEKWYSELTCEHLCEWEMFSGALEELCEGLGSCLSRMQRFAALVTEVLRC